MNDDENKENKPDDVYDELKGYFPSEYDLSPDELEHTPDTNSFEENDFSPIWEDLNEPEIKPEIMNEEASVKAEPQAQSKFLDAFDILEMFTICTACIIIFFAFFARLTIVDGESMEDTLKNGQFLVISDLMYTPTHGDIVVLQNTSLLNSELKKPLVKRIIAVGGQTVDITENGVVTVTDPSGTSVVLNEDYTKNEPYLKSGGHFTVPSGYIFVMGDNRNNSTDSRDSRVGFIDERCVVGKAMFRILPFGSATVFKNPFTGK